jgi:hypothetical protein
MFGGLPNEITGKGIQRLSVGSCSYFGACLLEDTSARFRPQLGTVYAFCVVLVATCGLDNFDDKLGNVHLDMQLEDVNERVELDVDKTILNRHTADKKDVQAYGQCHHADVELEQRLIFGQTVQNKPISDRVDEIEVEARIPGPGRLIYIDRHLESIDID